ncbi:RsbRD N-terminal domain-containing protein [Thermodesulfatator atlanticus]|uniref:RsbRD N-terminal domain-containing protein n=1 Tax=Thermodesulfatator atlanticus TaxID=501497 RepID=UPI0003B439D3|nr:RsbRD N-terminal domain-containing protein [Thermodesulfatator atlanticus]
MKIKELIEERRADIESRWYELILETYPKEAAAFFKKNKDEFTNPVGARLSTGVIGILQEIIKEEPSEDKIKEYLDEILRVRAVQEFTPAEAVRAIPLVKKAIRDVLSAELEDISLLKEFLALEDQIDEITLKGFEIYHQCRERLYHLKVEEWKSRMYMLLRRAKMVYDEREGSIPPEQI